jgi:hypothetical protein
MGVIGQIQVMVYLTMNIVQIVIMRKKTITVSGNSIFAGTEFKGVYLSTDNGSNWDSIK